MLELKFEALSKHYGSVQALKEFSCTLGAGVHGLLGPNGAGKSTLMNILSGNLHQSSGTVSFDGADIRSREYYARLGFMPQQQALYPRFTCLRFLSYMAALRGMERKQAEKAIDAVLEQVELTEQRLTRINALSGGMKQRLLLAQALLAQPDILLLDEPTAGLDPKQRISIRNLIASVAVNKVVLISTHVVPDVEFIAKDILLLQKGVLLEQSTPRALTQTLDGLVQEVIIRADCLSEYERRYRVAGIAPEDEGFLRLRLLADAPVGKAVTPTLEDVYLHHFGE